MSKDRIDVSDNTSISMPVRNMLAIIAAVAVGAWAYFGVLERITMLETKSVLTEKDLEQRYDYIRRSVCQHVGMGSCDMGNYIHSKKGLICLELDYSL